VKPILSGFAVRLECAPTSWRSMRVINFKCACAQRKRETALSIKMTIHKRQENRDPDEYYIVSNNLKYVIQK
jgi:hypothetical protein